MARELARHLYGDRLRLSGMGRWERRPEGGWALVFFKVESFEVLELATLSQAISEIRALVEADAGGGPSYDLMVQLRGAEEGTTT